MNFSQKQARLRDELARRIKRGELSVSLLARKTGLTQGHLSNFLRGFGLSIASLDRIVDSMPIDIDKLTPVSGHRAPESNPVTLIPLVSHSAAIFDPASVGSHSSSANQSEARMIPVTTAFLRQVRRLNRPPRLGWERFVAIEVSPEDVDGMEPMLSLGMIVILDRHYNSFYPYADALQQPSAHAPTRNPVISRINLSAFRVNNQLVIRYGEYKSGAILLRPYWIGAHMQVVPVPSRVAANELIVGRVILRIGEP